MRKERLKRFSIIAISIIVLIFVPHFVGVTTFEDKTVSVSITWVKGFFTSIVIGYILGLLWALITMVFKWIWNGS